MVESDFEEVPTAPWYIWVGLVVIALVSFWCQAVVTEERCVRQQILLCVLFSSSSSLFLFLNNRLVPALNVIADYYNIPDDIAGATMMAAGASSPELFSSVVALFITHSSLGLGTIVGSEIFNQLVICAGAVFASKTGHLQLDRAIVTREVGFYALSIVLLYFALQDTEPTDDDELNDHIFISFWEAVMVFSGYILYVLVCANMETIVDFFTKSTDALSTRSTISYGSVGSTEKTTIDVPNMKFVAEKKTLSTEPAANWNTVEYFVPTVNETRDSFAAAAGNKHQLSKSIRRAMGSSIRESARESRLKVLVNLFEHSERPSDLHDMYNVEENEYTGTMGCFLWQKSHFYNKAYFASHAWHLRWFTMSPQKISSVPDRQDPDDHRMTYPKFKHIQVDEDRLIVKVFNPIPGKRDLTFMAPSKLIFDKVISRFEKFMESQTSLPVPAHSPDDEDDDDDEEEQHDDADAHIDLIEFPADGSNAEIIFWVFLSPLRFLLHYTVPDVRQLDRNGDPMGTVGGAFFATFMCLVWLVIGSYAMVASLESLAELMDIPDSVIGVTVSAAGTSLPNYVASKVAAENGFGNQAVSNAFGSNTFNIMVGLGLPWLLYTSFGTGFQPYHGLKAEGILLSIIILGAVLLLFVVLMLQTGFVLYKWHGILFLVVYAAYILLNIAMVFTD